MAPQPVTINGVEYKSAAAANRYIKERIVANAGKTIESTDADYELFIDIVKQSPRRGWYMKSGIKSFTVTVKNSLTVNRNDGQSLDISYSKCINKREVDKLTAAMRTAIVLQIKDYKYRHYESGITKCSNPGCKTASKPLTDATVHVDHDNEFILIKEAFMAKQLKKNIPKSFALNRVDGVYRKNAIMFKDDITEHKRFKENWQLYHMQHAVLKLVCRTCNLSTLKKKRNSDAGKVTSIAESSNTQYSTLSTTLNDSDWIE